MTVRMHAQRNARHGVSKLCVIIVLGREGEKKRREGKRKRKERERKREREKKREGKMNAERSDKERVYPPVAIFSFLYD